MKVTFYLIACISCLLCRVHSNPINIFGSLRNATLSATTFLSDTIERQTNLLLQIKDTASEYVSNAVEKPRNMLIHAKEATRDFIDETTSRGLEVKFRIILESLRTMMPTGIPAINLPPLEPFSIEHQFFHIDDKDIGNISLGLDNVTVHNLSTYVIDHAKLSMINGPSITVNFTIPTLHAEGTYTMVGNFGGAYSVNGSGPFSLDARTLRAYVHAVLGFSGKLYLAKLDLDYSVKNVTLRFHGLFNNEALDETMSKVISEIAPELSELVKPKILPGIGKLIGEQVNATISQLTMANIIGILTGTSSLADFSHLISSPRALPPT